MEKDYDYFATVGSVSQKIKNLIDAEYMRVGNPHDREGPAWYVRDQIDADPEYREALQAERALFDRASYSYNPALWQEWVTYMVALRFLYYATGDRLELEARP